MYLSRDLVIKKTLLTINTCPRHFFGCYRFVIPAIYPRPRGSYLPQLYIVLHITHIYNIYVGAY